MRALSAVFVAGSVGLAAATGTLATLIGAGVFAAATYATMARGGRKRIELEVADELQATERAIALLERFLGDKREEALKSEEDVALMKSLFPNAMAGKEFPDWETLTVLRQRAEMRKEEFSKAVKSRVPKNDFAAAGAGLATFLWPVVGIAAIGYTVAANRAQTLSLREKARERQARAAKREADSRTRKAQTLRAKRLKQRARKAREEAKALEHAEAEAGAEMSLDEAMP